VIAFGCPITEPDEYARCAGPGIQRAVEPDSVILAEDAVGSLFKSYNHLLDKTVSLPDLEAVVLLHQDTEIVDADFCDEVRAALADRDVGVIGCVGAIGVRSIAWWEGSVTLSSFVNRYHEHGGGELPGFSWSWEEAPPYAHVGEVDTIDGFLMVLSPWVVRNIRFDESLSDFHGYDLDYCLQVRERGRKVMTADFRAIHHRPLEMLPDVERWTQDHVRVAEKWDGRMPGIGHWPGTWEERARRAEAETDAAFSLAHTKLLEGQARRRRLERALAEAKGSISWRLTAPLRWVARR
jgi:hypothetical protein